MPKAPLPPLHRRCGQRSCKHQLYRRSRSKFFRRSEHSDRRLSVAVMVELATSDPDCGSVRAKGGNCLSCPDVWQPRAFLPVCPEQRNRPSSQPLHGKGEISQSVMTGQAFRGSHKGSAHPAASSSSGSTAAYFNHPPLPNAATNDSAGGVGVTVIYRGQFSLRPNV